MDQTQLKLMESVLTETADSNTTGMATFGALNSDLISKIYPETFVSQIANIQPSKSPVCKIAAIFANYTGSASNNTEGVHYTNSLVITVPATAGLTYGATFAVNGNTFNVVYVEQNPSKLTPSSWPLVGTYGIPASASTTQWNVLIALTQTDQTIYESAGASAITSVKPGMTINGNNILAVSRNKTAIKRMFFNYTTYTTGIGEIINPNMVGFETKTTNLQAGSRKVKAKITYEKLQDLKALYGGVAMDSIINNLASQIGQEIDYEIINYLKTIASPYQDITFNMSVSGSIGYANSDLTGITSDMYFAILFMVDDIIRKTRRNRTMFVLADAFTSAVLQMNPLFIKASTSMNNPSRVGTIGAYPLFVDYFSSDNYMLVGYAYDGKTEGDAGLIYSPYLHEMIEIDDAVDMFKKNILAMNRYAYTRHPQDAGTSIGDSDFFQICQLDFRNMKHLSTWP